MQVAWVDCIVGLGNCDIYTRALAEESSHLVTNRSAAHVQNPFVDGNRI